jgi:PAS domain S-box-containing protein
VTTSSGHAHEILWEDGELVLSRSVWEGEAFPLLATMPSSTQPSLGTLRRLQHAYALREELDPTWAARPVRLEPHQGRLALLSEDPGGEPLLRLLGRPLAIASFLRVSIGLANALTRLHERGLIHKDIKPANVLVNSATGHAWLTGFGIASRLPRERQAPAPPEVVAGTLAYMAPEQTGRMNRSIDSRSDLYSLGVTLYEMLTGELPFTASDPMEWVHCHIARRPAAPDERVVGIPRPVSAIVMKLLGKNAEDRYQTAAGLAVDLRKCLTEWESDRGIEPFPLGADDASDRLMAPEKLYGREREIETLLGAFDRVVANGATELVLVSGYAGMGKSSVVNELQKALVPPRGLFASGKFDQYKRDIPYATLAQAFRSLVRPLLGESETKLGRWRNSLSEALGPNGQLIVNLVPELELVIGKQPPVADLPPQDAKNRFQMVFRRFLSVFAREEHPLALFLDDLQWLDAATLDLLEHLVTHPEVRHLLMVGAYRDNEVGRAHPLTRTLEAIRNAGARVEETVLTPLGLDDIARLVTDALHCPPERARPLAQLVHEKTSGNPFFAIQFLTTLHEEGLLAFDSVAPAWRWDVDRIHARNYTDNVADLLVEKMKRLSIPTQEAMKQLACLGNVADVATLTLVYEEAEEVVHAALHEAVYGGLVLGQDNAYTFLHDRIQQAAYSLIPEERRAEVHLGIGRALLASMTADELAEHLLDVANQLNRGVARLIDRDEKAQVATIDLRAGRKAKASAAYASARAYFSAGAALLDERDWDSQYELMFSLRLEQAECEYLTGQLASAEARLSLLSTRARTIVDSAAVTCVRLNLYTILDRSDSAVEVGLDYLRRVDDGRWPLRATAEDVREAYDRLLQRLGSAPIESLAELPLMTDADRSATMDVLTMLTSPALFTGENLFRLVVCRMATLSLEHGNSNGSCLAYAWLGSMLGMYFGDYQAGFRFGRLGLDLAEKPGLDRFRARVCLVFAVHVVNWTQHLSFGRGLLRRAFAAAQEAGDLPHVAYSCVDLVTNFLASGDPLSEAQQEAENGLEFVRKMSFGLVSDCMTGQLRLIRMLRGLTPTFTSFGDAEFDEGSFEQRLESNPQLAFAASWYWIRKLQACIYAGDYASAVAAAAKSASFLWTTPTQFELAEYHFYAALARAGRCEIAVAEERPRHMESLAAHLKQIAIWADNCPATFANRAALVGAEIARIEGRELDAERLYEAAIRSAGEQGFIQNEGLANELAANFYAARGFETIARAYLRDARSCYLRWGADGKVRQLDHAHPHLRQQSAPSASTATIGASIEQLDVGAAVKASQAVSGEIVLDRLMKILMTIALEHAGAQRGLLILLHGDTLRIEAEARTDQKTVEVTIRQEALTAAEMPQSLLHTVIRMRRSVILDDASAEDAFSADDYIREKRARSVLCLPLVKQAELIGVLYLENNLASRVFTPARISMLELLASQAAISLENARLYGELTMSEERWRNLFESVPIGVSMIGLDQRYIATNPAYQRMMGYSEAELRSLTPVDLIHEDDRAAAKKIIAAQLAGRPYVQHRQSRYVRKDGGVIWAEVDAFPAPVAGSAPLLGGLVVDITERKRAEEALRDARADLERMGRLTTMGELTASIAHEINQPLAAVVTQSEAALRFLDRDEPDLDEVQDALSAIRQDGTRASEVIRSLRALAKKSEPQLTKLDVDDVIRKVLVVARGELLRHDVVLRTQLAAEDRPVIGDRVQLQQVLLNLIMNGVDAMKEVTERARELTVSSMLAEPGSVLVAVEDTGTGLDPAVAERVFQPFFTTKPDGLGMGLSICRSIIEAHGGRLWVSPHAPHGADVRFTVPLWQNATAQS